MNDTDDRNEGALLDIYYFKNVTKYIEVKLHLCVSNCMGDRHR